MNYSKNNDVYPSSQTPAEIGFLCHGASFGSASSCISYSLRESLKSASARSWPTRDCLLSSRTFSSCSPWAKRQLAPLGHPPFIKFEHSRVFRLNCIFPALICSCEGCGVPISCSPCAQVHRSPQTHKPYS